MKIEWRIREGVFCEESGFIGIYKGDERFTYDTSAQYVTLS
jgi:hypothetical protein